jgi:hypothetical protein
MQSYYLLADGLDSPGIKARFSAPIQTGPGAHPTSCSMGTGSPSWVQSGQGEVLTTHTHPALKLKKE